MRLIATALLICTPIVIFIGGLSGPAVANAQDRAIEERLLKAAYIFNFAKFTSWPETVWNDINDPLTLCTTGKDKLIVELEKLGGKIIKDRPVNVRHMKSSQIPGNCQLLYIATSERKRFTKIIKSVASAPILTVSEIPNFGQSGGIVELFSEKGHLRFTVNLASVREAGLVISSRLLRLAILINAEDES